MIRIVAFVASVAATLIGGPLHAAKPAPLPAGWDRYVNARFGYSICYPATALLPQPEAENGDGRIFKGNRRGGRDTTLRVWGQHNALEESIESDFAKTLENNRKAGFTVTYQALHKGRNANGWFVISGKRHGVIFYTKHVLRNGAFSVMELQHAAARAEYWDGATARISRCFGS